MGYAISLLVSIVILFLEKRLGCIIVLSKNVVSGLLMISIMLVRQLCAPVMRCIIQRRGY